MTEKKKTTRRRRKKTNPSTEAKAAVAEQEAKDAKAAEEAAKTEAEKAAKAEAKEQADKEAAEAKKATETKKKNTKASKIKLDEVVRLETMLKEYAAIAPGGVATEATRQLKVRKLVKIVTFISANPKKEVLTAMYNFFKQEKAGLMAETLVLQGTNGLNSTTREKVELLYGAMVITMRNAKSKKKIRPNIDLINKRLGDGVGSWFATKNK